MPGCVAGPRKGVALAIVCGRYEGIDQRFLDVCVDEVVSVGDFVMSGGELAAMALIDAVVRQLPGALKEASADEESFATGLLDGPHYTRPELWRGREVPAVLLSGHHADIEAWRRRQALRGDGAAAAGTDPVGADGRAPQRGRRKGFARTCADGCSGIRVRCVNGNHPLGRHTTMRAAR